MSRRSKARLLRFIAYFLFALGVLVGGLAPSAYAASSAAQVPTLAKLKQQPLASLGVAGGVTLLIHGVSDTSDHLPIHYP